VLLLTTIGRRTGRPRTTPLLFHRAIDGSLLLVAVNGTNDWDPDWLHNLAANPRGKVEIDGVRKPVQAVVLDDAERAAMWDEACRAFPGLEAAQAECRRRASGKSTVAEALAQQFSMSVHVRGGQFFRWAARGWVHFDDAERQAEARRLLELRYRLSALVADEYAAAGFTAVVQDNIYGTDVVQRIDRTHATPAHLVVLRPSIDVLEQRHEERRERLGKVAYRGGYTAALNDRDLAATPRELGLWLDTSRQTAEATVDEILARSAEAIVP